MDLTEFENFGKEKKHRSSISIDLKLYILKRFDEGERAVQIANSVGLPPSTIRTIRNSRDKIIKSANNGTPISQTKVSRSRSSLMENMERDLIAWIQEYNKQKIPINIKIIQIKAKRIYEKLRQEQSESGEVIMETFDASRGWFERFKKRSNLNKTNGDSRGTAGELYYLTQKNVSVDSSTGQPKEMNCSMTRHYLTKENVSGDTPGNSKELNNQTDVSKPTAPIQFLQLPQNDQVSLVLI